MHRLEVLHHGSTDEFEYWTNPDGSIYLCRERSDDVWQAIVDGDVLMDSIDPFQVQVTVPAKALTAPSAVGLVPLLALQANIHVIMDYESHAHVS